jgi:hypothetical protein
MVRIAQHEQADPDALCARDAGQSKAVATIVAGPGDDHDVLQPAPTLVDFTPDHRSRTTHQFSAWNSVELDRGAIELVNLVTVE